MAAMTILTKNLAILALAAFAVSISFSSVLAFQPPTRAGRLASPPPSSLPRRSRDAPYTFCNLSLRAASSTTTDDSSDKSKNNNNAIIANGPSKVTLEQKTWMFQDKYPIAYEVAKNNQDKNEGDENKQHENKEYILLLNGFGVGSFHQHRLMRQLLSQQQEHRQINQRNMKSNDNNETSSNNKEYVIYGIDYLGQGKSWPINCNDGNSQDELNLGYSADLWLDQITGFIQNVILSANSQQKVHIVGNSVGGYLATILTSRHAQLIASLTLLNATPVWGLNLPYWDGKLPAPPIPKMVGRALFDAIRDEGVIEKYLEAAYVHREAFDGTYDIDDGFYCGNAGTTRTNLGAKIRECTEGNGGHAAFASILWSPPASLSQEQQRQQQLAQNRMMVKEELSLSSSSLPQISQPIGFYDALEGLPVDVLLLFGSNDPWCTPAVAKRMHSTLARRGGVGSSSSGNITNDVKDAVEPASRYITIDNVGHCPNHEAPLAVAEVLCRWINAASTTSSSSFGGGSNNEISSNDRQKVLLVSSSVSSGDGVQISEPWADVWVREVSIEESNNLEFMDWIVSNMVG